MNLDEFVRVAIPSYDIIEVVLLSIISFGLLLLGVGTHRIGDHFKDYDNEGFTEKLNQLSKWERLQIFLFIFIGTSLFTIGFIVLLAYGSSKW